MPQLCRYPERCNPAQRFQARSLPAHPLEDSWRSREEYVRQSVHDQLPGKEERASASLKIAFQLWHRDYTPTNLSKRSIELLSSSACVNHPGFLYSVSKSPRVFLIAFALRSDRTGEYTTTKGG